MKRHKDCLSRTTLKRLIGGKYNKTITTAVPNNPQEVFNRKGELIRVVKPPKGYLKLNTGWRRFGQTNQD